MKTLRSKQAQRVVLILMTWLFTTDFVLAQDRVQRLRGLRAQQPGLEEIAERVGPPVGPPALPAPNPAGPARPDAGDDAAIELAEGEEPMIRLTYVQATLDIVLADYSEHTGRTLLLAPGVTTQPITLQSEGGLPLSEWLNAIETVLNMYGVALLEEGDRFTRVVPNKTARSEPMEIIKYNDDILLEDSGELISQMIALKHIEVGEAVNAIKTVHHPYANVTSYEGINSLMITDTASSINRVLQILEYIDVPIEAREEPFIVQILYAKSSDIKSKLEQIIAEAQKEQKKSTVQRQRDSGPPGVTTTAPRTPAGVIRARRTPTPATAAAANVLADVERGLIRGEVKIIDDERTNLLIIITRPENIPFFEKIIKVLDVETQPDVMVRVFRLEYAEAKDVESMLNQLIGASSGDDVATPPADTDTRAGGGTALRDYVAQRETRTQQTTPNQRTTTRTTTTVSRKSKVGELSQENIKIPVR